METFKFYKEETGEWYIDLPDWQGSKDALQMVCGADLLLDMLSNGGSSANLTVSLEPFDNSMVLVLEDKPEEVGGGNYKLKEFKGTPLDLDVWLCPVVEFVFNYIPDHIYFN